jgi:hypothetical protein
MRLSPKRFAVLIGSASLLLAIAGLIAWRIRHDTEPSYQGRRVSYWYDSLCSGVFGGTPRAQNFPAAYDAFSHMGPEVVPCLTQRLQYDRFGFRENIILHVRKVAPLKRFTKTLIFPTERRCYAAVALRQMGPKARTAIPALLEAWVNDNSKVKINAVSALEAILGHKPSDGLGAADWANLEKKIISEAAQEYPKDATRLGINAITTEAVQN